MEEADSFRIQRRASLLGMGERHRGGSVPLCYMQGTRLPYTDERVSSLYRGEIVPLLYVEVAYPFSIARTECLHRGESAPLLYVEEADPFSRQRRESFFFTQRRENPSTICRGGILLLYTEERRSQRRESISVLYVKEADSFSIQR